MELPITALPRLAAHAARISRAQEKALEAARSD
jgi:hypothetical protein